MKRMLVFILATLVVCPIIMISVLASAEDNSQALKPQDIKTQAQLTSYIDEIQALSAEIENSSIDSSSHITATITFSKYISFNELKEYINNFDIDLQQIQLRGRMADGTRVTIATLVHEGMEYTENLMYLQAAEQEFNLVGITDVYAYILPNQIEEISNNSLTYLVDISGNVAPANVQNTDGDVSEFSPVFPKSLTWELEDLNLL